MKKRGSRALSVLFAFLAMRIHCGSAYPTSTGASVVQTPVDKPCAEGITVVEEQANVPARLSVKKAMCGDTYSAVELLIENVSTKDISGFEVAQTQDYEYKKDVKSAESQSGDVIKPGESKMLNFSGGFLDGYSYGKPVGLLRHNAFKVSWVEFTDGTSWGQKTMPVSPNKQTVHDLVLRDDKEPYVAAFQYDNQTFSIMSCGEYGFGGPGLRIERSDCKTQLAFDFRWRSDADFSYHPRGKPEETITIRVGDNLHGEFTFDSCTKTATGIIRDENQNLILMILSDTDTSGKRGYCSGPPDYK